MPSDGLALLLPDIGALLLCMLAAATDVRSYRIPNRLTLYGAGAGLALNSLAGAMTGGPHAALLASVESIAGGAFLLAVFGGLGALRLLGLGDVKLLFAVGLCVRWPLALHVLVCTVLAGGAVALTLALLRGALPRLAYDLVSHPVRPARRLHRMPYGIAILAGTCWAIAGRYLPESMPI